MIVNIIHSNILLDNDRLAVRVSRCIDKIILRLDKIATVAVDFNRGRWGSGGGGRLG